MYIYGDYRWSDWFWSRPCNSTVNLQFCTTAKRKYSVGGTFKTIFCLQIATASMSKKFKIQVLVNAAVNGIYTSADHIIVLEAHTNMHDCKRSGETYPPWPGFLYATIAGPPPAPAIARPPARKMALPQTWTWKRSIKKRAEIYWT